jgi:hypothetical protein
MSAGSEPDPTTAAGPVPAWLTTGPPPDFAPPVPFPTQPPRRGRTALVGLATVVAVLVIAGGSVGATIAMHHAPADRPISLAVTPPAAPVPTPSASPTPTYFAGDLRTLLLPAPSTAHPFKSPISSDGQLSIDTLAKLYQSPAGAKQYLASMGYLRGAVRQWHDADDTQVEINLMQFDSPRLAKRFMYSDAASERDQNRMSDHGKVGSAVDSLVLVDSTPDSKGYAAVEMYALKGNIVEHLLVWQVSRPKITVAVALATRQYARLP